MEMEFVRLANVSWLQIPDRQVLAMRAVALSADRSPPRWGSSADILRPVPILDWPATLFDDETHIH
jgi:hypothetical protein